MDYTDRTLLKLKRRYSKDEVVASLTKKLKDAEIKNGKLISEIQHLEFELTEKINKKEENKLVRIEARKNELYQNILSQNKKMRKEIKKLRQLRTELFSKINQLEK